MKRIKAKNFVAKLLESILVIGYILFEELIWDVFAKPIFQYIKSLVVLDSLKKIFLKMNRHLLLTVFIVILAITEAMGFLSGFCFINGYILTGMGVYACKIPIAAFTFWLFDLTKDKLMTFNWLKTSYNYIMGVIEKFINSSIHISIKTQISTIRTKIKSLVIEYFGEDGFIVSVKSHYLVFKPYILNLLKR
ncbi:MAG: hypothetical protein KAH20_00525 [Methylococcales bacterium]|nr:hypothetical protein [Methylococcales bacterium]